MALLSCLSMSIPASSAESGFSDNLRFSVGRACPAMFDSPSLNMGTSHKKHVGSPRICDNVGVSRHTLAGV